MPDMKRGNKNHFYNAIGVSPRTAQRYMKIASNAHIQNMKKNKLLDKLNLTQMLIIIGEKQEVSNNTIVDFSKVANGIFTRYQDPEQIKAIINELNKLLVKNQSA